MFSEKDLLKAYLKSLKSKWYVLVDSLLFLFGLFSNFIPWLGDYVTVIVLTISFIGIIAAGYKVYRDLFMIIPEENRLAYLPPKKGEPELNIYQIGGKDYDYGYRARGFNNFQLDNSNERKVLLPSMAGQFYFTISNIGFIPIRILSIKGHFDLKTPLSFTVPRAIENDNEELKYPIDLFIGDKKEITFYVAILPRSSLSDAEIAANIRDLLLEQKQGSFEIKIKMEYGDRKIAVVQKTFSFSPERLFNLYIHNWRTLHEEKLLSLIEGK